ncbi:hypothetical protein [Streptomyces longispororuber]|uniref:hypothetical protein n=1 Tax=Streptomyces longispororuber TaxID=68230 RepID=UPI00210CF168|nr:hypothetical protein [Streptomyces longispororuber]MCQ4211361.1 hypothetical protein [Streptomyces longispororuber]
MGAWRIEYVSRPDNVELRTLSVNSAQDAWAFGLAGEDWDSRLLVHYDGRRWTEYDFAADLPEIRGVTLAELASSGPDNTWFFGTDDPVGSRGTTPVIARWDGSRWRKMPLPRRMPERVKDAAVFAPDDVWLLAGSNSMALPGEWPALERTGWHWDGRRWTERRLPAEAVALAGRAADDIWAVGRAPDPRGEDTPAAARRTKPAAMHYDGHTWRLVPTPAFQPPVDAPPGEGSAEFEDVVVSPQGGVVWAVGDQTYPNDDVDANTAQSPVVARWNGGRWEKRSTPDELEALAVLPVASDGAQGLVFSGGRLRADGRFTSVGRPPLLPDKTGEVTRVARQQQLSLRDLVQVPGTRQAWGAGSIAVGSGGEGPNFSYGVVVRAPAAE